MCIDKATRLIALNIMVPIYRTTKRIEEDGGLIDHRPKILNKNLQNSRDSILTV